MPEKETCMLIYRFQKRFLSHKSGSILHTFPNQFIKLKKTRSTRMHMQIQIAPPIYEERIWIRILVDMILPRIIYVYTCVVVHSLIAKMEMMINSICILMLVHSKDMENLHNALDPCTLLSFQFHFCCLDIIHCWEYVYATKRKSTLI